MQRGTDGPNNALNGIVRIGVKFYSQMSVAYAFNQTIARDVFGGSLVRLNILEHCPASAARWWFPDALGCIMWGCCMPLVVMEGAEMAIVQPYRQNFGEELVLMDDNSRHHRAHLVNEFLHDNNIARLKWPACSPDMHPI